MAAVAGLVPWAESGIRIFLARVALRLEIGADQQDAGELAVGSGRGLQGDGVHAGDFDELIAAASS